jgi:hypothetical protein
MEHQLVESSLRRIGLHTAPGEMGIGIDPPWAPCGDSSQHRLAAPAAGDCP